MKKKHRIIVIVCLVILFLAVATYHINYDLLPLSKDYTQPNISKDYYTQPNISKELKREKQPEVEDILKQRVNLPPTQEEIRKYPTNN